MSHPLPFAPTAYLASMFVIQSEFHPDTANLQKYAAQYAMAVTFANYGGPSRRLNAAGGSAIWSPTGKRVTQLESAGAGVAVAHERRSGWQGETAMLDRGKTD